MLFVELQVEDMIWFFLITHDCGPEGEPCVVHIDQEGGYWDNIILADNFKGFCGWTFPSLVRVMMMDD